MLPGGPYYAKWKKKIFKRKRISGNSAKCGVENPTAINTSYCPKLENIPRGQYCCARGEYFPLLGQ